MTKKTETKKNIIKALIELEVQPEKVYGFDRIADKIASFDNVKSYYLMSGQYDFMLIVEGDTLQDVSSFVATQLSTIEQVRSTKTRFVLTTYKEDGELFDQSDSKKRLPITL